MAQTRLSRRQMMKKGVGVTTALIVASMYILGLDYQWYACLRRGFLC